MRIPIMLILTAAGALFGTLRAEDALEGSTQSPCVFSLDSNGSHHEVKTQADLNSLWQATCRAGGRVTYVKPDGTTATLIETASSATSVALPLVAGGLWTFSNSLDGTATFTVRHSLYGTLGDGTENSPAKIVDGDELIDYVAEDGYVFTLNGTCDLLGSLVLPANICLNNAGDGKLRLSASANGCLYRWTGLEAPIDSEAEGSDRVTTLKNPMAIAYSGDNWVGAAGAASSLTFISPNGVSTTLNRKGTGAERFKFSSSGLWTVRLVLADGTTRESEITVLKSGFTLLLF